MLSDICFWIVIVLSILMTVTGAFLISCAMKEKNKDHYEPSKVLMCIYPGILLFGSGFGLFLLFVGLYFALSL